MTPNALKMHIREVVKHFENFNPTHFGFNYSIQIRCFWPWKFPIQSCVSGKPTDPGLTLNFYDKKIIYIYILNVFGNKNNDPCPPTFQITWCYQKHMIIFVWPYQY
jgi:hypothetical protein